MAYDKGCVVGEVVEINNGEKWDVVIVHDESKPQYPNDVACEFSGKSRELIRNVQVGDWVAVEGSIRSKRSPKTGQWFTNFACYSVGHVNFGSRSAGGGGQRQQQHREERGNDEPLPF